MPKRFNPPVGADLASVDEGRTQYDDHCTTIEGVISPRAQGGWLVPKADYQVHCFTLAVWRRPGAPLVERALTILRPVPVSGPGSMRDGAFEELPAYSIQRFRVLLARDQTRAVLEEVLPLEQPGEDLQQLADRLRQPTIVPTRRFGDLVLDPSLGWYEGKASWNRKPIEVQLDPEEDGSITGALETAEQLWSDQQGWKKKVDDYAVEKLLPLKNEFWLADDAPQVTARQFQQRMELDSITVRARGEFEFWHKDGGLFAGHSICIRGDLTTGPDDADIPG